MKKPKDRRVKLTPEQKLEILLLKGKYTQQELADRFGVSRRTISFIHNPESLEKNLQRRKERGGNKRYYNKEKHREYMAKYRKRKKEAMLKEGGLE